MDQQHLPGTLEGLEIQQPGGAEGINGKGHLGPIPNQSVPPQPVGIASLQSRNLTSSRRAMYR